MHLQSLARFDFDTVMLPFNYALMQNPRYAKDWDALIALCRERNVAIQTMKTIARVPCRGRSETYHTYFYEPLETLEAIDRAVHWVLGEPGIIAATVGDMQLLPKVLDAATRYSGRPSEADMAAHVTEYGIQAVFK
jgi:hypothetical protein